MAAAIQAAIGTKSEKLEQILKIAPRLVDVYSAIALRDVNDCKLFLFCLFSTCHCFCCIELLQIVGCSSYKCIAKSLTIGDVFIAALICALIPLLMSRSDKIFPDKKFSYEVHLC